MSENMVCKGRHYLNMDTQIRITGTSEVMIEYCKKIIEFNEIMVKVKSWDMTVVVWGSELRVNDYDSGGISVCGKISSVELEGNG